MGVRDEEIQRIKNYAKGLGVELVFASPDGSGDQASWSTDGSRITIYTQKHKSKTDIIFDLIHELSHHLAWVHKGRTTLLKTDRALDRENLRTKKDPPIAKEQRKIIYEDEKSDAEYQPLIFAELNIKIPKYKFLAQKDLDVWAYYKYYMNGDFPSLTDYKEKRKELQRKYN